MNTTLRVCDLSNIDRISLEKFFAECTRLGFINNISLEAIRVDFVKQRKGNFWFLLKGEEIIGMAGCHRFDEYSPDSFRILFRGCELPGKDVKPGLSRSNFNSSCFRELLPYQLKWIEDQGYDKTQAFISVNHGHKNIRTMEIIERQGCFTEVADIMLFGVQQKIWKLNTDYYESIRKKVTSYVV